MKVIDIICNMGIDIGPDDKIVIYGNHYFNSPIEVDLQDDTENDYALVIMLKNIPTPKSLREINMNRNMYRLAFLYNNIDVV